MPEPTDAPAPERDLDGLVKSRVQTVRLGDAPDGLPWTLTIDRAARVRWLHEAVCSVFGLSSIFELPPALAHVVDNDLGQALIGLHEVELEAGKPPQTCYVSARSIRSLLGPSLLSALLGEGDRTMVPPPSHPATTAIVPSDRTRLGVGSVQAFERSLAERRTSRRLVIPFRGEGLWTGGVVHADRALRRPTAPFNAFVFERLGDWRGARAEVEDSGEPFDLTRPNALADAVRQGSPTDDLVRMTYGVPRATVLDALLDVAQSLSALHGRGVLHGDLSPANILFSNREAVLIDGLDVPIGSSTAAATYAWASPEQILGRPIDERSEVFVLGKLVASLLGGIGYGQQTSYTVPAGGRSIETVSLTMVEGVFIDTVGLDLSPAWQEAWCQFLSRCMNADPERRPPSAAAFAAEASDLARRHPPTGRATFRASFGRIGSNGPLQPCRVVSDG